MSSRLEKILRDINKIDRRDFLKLVGGVTAATASAGAFPLFNAFAQNTPNQPLPEKWVATSCFGCLGWCPMLVKVVDGKAVSIKGNPASKVTEGRLCARGMMGLQQLYDPDRIKTPLKRTNPKKGINEDPKFVPISWDEAWKELTTRMNALREAGTPEKVIMLRGRYTQASSTYWYGTFAQAYGTPNSFQHGGICADGSKMGGWLGDGRFNHPDYDLENMRYLIAFGNSPIEASRGTTRLIRCWSVMRGRPDRAKIVVVDPRMSVSAAKADQWLPVNSGTDAALALSMAHVILTNGLWDRQFVGDFIDGKNGFVKGAEVAEDQFKEIWTFGLIKWWNTVLKDFTPEIAEKETGISADTIKRVAVEFATLKPSAAIKARGTGSWPGGGYTGYAVYSLNALVGSMHQVGGLFNPASPPKYWNPPKVEADDISAVSLKKKRIDERGTPRFLRAEIVTNNIADNILAGKPYPVELAIVHCSNFAFSAPGTERWWKAFEKIWMVNITPNISETALFADIVFPAGTHLETWAFDQPSGGSLCGEIQIKQPVVKPLYESMPIEQFAFELAKRLGGHVASEMAKVANDPEDYIRKVVQPLMDFEQFKKIGVISTPPIKLGNPEGKFNTPSKKFEFVSGNLAKLFADRGVSPEDVRKAAGIQADGDMLYMPHYEKPRFIGDIKEYPLVLVTYKTHMNMEGRSGNCTWCQELFQVMYNEGWTNFAEINPRTAVKFGIRDGDQVIVESQIGKITMRAKVTPTVNPGICAMAYGQGHRAYGRWAKGRGANPNDITGVDYEAFSGMATFYNTRVKIRKA